MKIMRISSFSRKSAIARMFFLFFKIISKKSLFITICASQIVCRSCDQYADYGEVRQFRHFPKACHRPNVFIFFKYNFKKKCFYHDLRKSNRVPKLRPIYGLWRSTMISSFSESLPLPDHVSFSLKEFQKRVLLSRFAQVKSCAEATTDIRIMDKIESFGI